MSKLDKPSLNTRYFIRTAYRTMITVLRVCNNNRITVYHCGDQTRRSNHARKGRENGRNLRGREMMEEFIHLTELQAGRDSFCLSFLKDSRRVRLVCKL